MKIESGRRQPFEWIFWYYTSNKHCVRAARKYDENQEMSYLRKALKYQIVQLDQKRAAKSERIGRNDRTI